QPTGRGVGTRVRESEGDPHQKRPDARAGQRGHFGRARDRLLPADDGGLARSETSMAATIRLQREPFDAASEAAKLRRVRGDSGAATLQRGRGAIGAVVTLTGIFRGQENGAPLVALTLEHYPDLAEAEVARDVEAAERRFFFFKQKTAYEIGQ